MSFENSNEFNTTVARDVEDGFSRVEDDVVEMLKAEEEFWACDELRESLESSAGEFIYYSEADSILEYCDPSYYEEDSCLWEGQDTDTARLTQANFSYRNQVCGEGGARYEELAREYVEQLDAFVTLNDEIEGSIEALEDEVAELDDGDVLRGSQEKQGRLQALLDYISEDENEIAARTVFNVKFWGEDQDFVAKVVGLEAEKVHVDDWLSKREAAMKAVVVPGDYVGTGIRLSQDAYSFEQADKDLMRFSSVYEHKTVSDLIARSKELGDEIGIEEERLKGLSESDILFLKDLFGGDFHAIAQYLFNKVSDDISLESADGNTLGHYIAMYKNSASLVDVFEAFGVLNDKKNKAGYTPLMLSLANENKDVCRSLVSIVEDPDAIIPGDDIPLLHYAIKHGDHFVVRGLVEKGADTRYVDTDGNSLFAIAVKNMSNSDKGKVLALKSLARVVDLSVENNQGESGMKLFEEMCLSEKDRAEIESVISQKTAGKCSHESDGLSL